MGLEATARFWSMWIPRGNYIPGNCPRDISLSLIHINELPYIPLGPFQWRIPGVHYRVEYVEFFQGLILGATALSSIPYLTDYLGLPYELAWSCVILEVALYMLHGWLGDPVVPGWITPTLPFTLAFISGFETVSYTHLQRSIRKGPDS